MTEDNPEKKRLLIEFNGPAAEIDRINAGIIDSIGDLAVPGSVSVEISNRTVATPPSWVNQPKAEYTQQLSRRYSSEDTSRIATELFTWVEHPETGESVAVITKHDIADFAATKQQTTDPTEPMQTRYQDFFGRLASYHHSRADENDDYVLFAKDKRPGEYLTRPLGIKVNGSLELLRRLKAADIGEHKMAIMQKGIRGIGPIMVNAFEEYLEELFPTVDVSLATQELDLELLGHMLDKSQKRAKVWSWLIEREVGSRFIASVGSAEISPRIKGANRYFINLQALGLIDRRPTGPYSIKPQFYAYEKMQDSRWLDLQHLMVERGYMPEPS